MIISILFGEPTWKQGLACFSAMMTVLTLPLSSVSCMSLSIQSPLQSVTSLLTLVVLANTAFLGLHTQFYGRHQQGQHTQHHLWGGRGQWGGLAWLLPKGEVISICTKMHTV